MKKFAVPEKKFGRVAVTINDYATIKRLYFDKDLARMHNVPWPISRVLGAIFIQVEGEPLFFGAQDTDGTPERVAQVNDAISHLGLTAPQLQAVGHACGEGLRLQHHPARKRAVVTSVLEAIIPRFVPGFKVTDSFYADYDYYTSVMKPGLSWLNPLTTHRQGQARDRILASYHGNTATFHHSIAAFGLVSIILNDIPSHRVRDAVEKAKSTGTEFPVLELLSSPQSPAGTVIRVVQKPTDLGGIVENPLPEGSLVFLTTARPDVNVRGERFLGCAAQRIITNILKYTVEDFYSGSKASLIPVGSRDEAVNPTSSDIFNEQDKL